MNAMMRIPVALAVLAGALGAQAPRAVVIEGQVLPGGGTVTGVRFVHVDSWGGLLVHVTTDQPTSPEAVLRENASYGTGVGPVWKEVGDRTHAPVGSQIAGFDSFSSEMIGGVTWNARLSGTPGGADDDEALYFESSLWIQEGPIASWPTTDFPAGSRWLSFDDLRTSTQDGYFLLRGRADDPTVAGPDESFAAVGGLCGSIGILCGIERFAQEGWPAPGMVQLIEAIRLDPGAGAVSPTSGHLMWSCDLAAPEGWDGCVFHLDLPSQNVLVAQEGTPSPIAGRTWGPLDDVGLHVNAAGTWTMRATLDASDPSNDAVIVEDDRIIVREGGSVPDIAPATFDGFGRSRALLDKAGHVVWYGHWDEQGLPAEGLFRDDRLLVRTGQTLIGGQLLVGLGSGPDDVSIGPLGEELLFKGTLAGGLEGAFALPLGP